MKPYPPSAFPCCGAGRSGCPRAGRLPSKAITLVVPVPPGGASDFIARTVGQKLSDALGQPVVISNRGGASGTIASDNVAKAAPDGTTLLMSSITTHGIGPLVNTNAPYDSLKDFTSIVFLADRGETPMVGTPWLGRFLVTYDLANARVRLLRPAVTQTRH